MCVCRIRREVVKLSIEKEDHFRIEGMGSLSSRKLEQKISRSLCLCITSCWRGETLAIMEGVKFGYFWRPMEIFKLATSHMQPHFS